MNFVLPGANVKMLARTVNCFSKIGNELFFSATPDGLEIKTINSTNTAYAVAQFKRDFFISFQQGDDDTPEENCCKISVKPILKIFKSLSKIQMCKIWLDVAQSKIIFQFRCKSEVLKTHKIYLLESEHINTLSITQTFPNEIIGKHKAFASMFHHLHYSVDEIMLDLKEDRIIISNYVDNDRLDQTTLRSALTIGPGTFDTYTLEGKANLIFCFKEFKAIIMFAGFTKLDIQMNFSNAGSPLMLQMNKSGVVQMKVILGTMQPSFHHRSRKDNGRVDRMRNTTNQSVRVDSEGINTFLTEDITHNSEPSKNTINSTCMRLNVTDTDQRQDFDGEKDRNRAEETSNANRKRTAQAMVHEDSNIARSTRSDIPAQLHSVLEQQHKTTRKPTLNSESSSETMFNTNTGNFPFMEGISLPTANNNNLNSLPSLPGATVDGNTKGKTRPEELFNTDSDNDLCEISEPLSTSVFSRKRNINDEGTEGVKKACIEATTRSSTDIVPESPDAIEERKRKQAKLRHIFRRCFEPTFDPAIQPGCSQIFAVNSDSEDES